MTAKEIQIDIALPEPKQVRGKGVHGSSIIRCIATETGILKPEWAEELSLADVRVISDPVAILRISIGLAWEEWYIPNILSKYGVIDHPGQMHYDGVYLTHDGEELSVILTLGRPKAQWKIHEVKTTYKSTKTVAGTDPAEITVMLESQWMWMAQIKAYCIARKALTAVLHVLFLCGDYKFPIKPVLKAWELEFTQEELDDNWQLLSQYRHERLRIEEMERETDYL